MSKKIILVGDPTSHGGVVISGSSLSEVNGKGIARLGDEVNCPQLYPDKNPHGVNKIVEGSDVYKIYGIPAALEGHKTVCGCTLIGTSNSKVG